jgi:hypothetical protein
MPHHGPVAVLGGVRRPRATGQASPRRRGCHRPARPSGGSTTRRGLARGTGRTNDGANPRRAIPREGDHNESALRT